jgi:hypothetical protein
MIPAYLKINLRKALFGTQLSLLNGIRNVFWGAAPNPTKGLSPLEPTIDVFKN